MGKHWRLLDPGPLSAYEQMALDKVVIEARSNDRIPDTLRFMEFSPHTALVGYHQSLDLEVNRDVCIDLGVECNRRITGGGAIYMDSRQLGFEICTSKDNPSIPTDPGEIYPKLVQVVVETLRQWGLDARFRPVNDVEVDGRKISGTGGAEWGNALIYQGTILIDFDVDTMLKVLKLPIEKLTDKVVTSFRQRIVTMRELLTRSPEIHEVKTALMHAVESVLGVQVEHGLLTNEENSEWLRQKPIFQHRDWVDRRPAPPSGQDLRQASHKAPGGLIKASLVVDATARRIRRAYLTGDFFVYPERAVLDLEASLKEAPMVRSSLEGLLEEHFARGYRYLGVSPDDWMTVLSRALVLE